MDTASPPNGSLESEIAGYDRWRGELGRSVAAFHDWLEVGAQLDVRQSIRFYDLLESLKKGRLTVAFLGESGRGKTELVNALFFPARGEGLLPTGATRTTRCPTEIFNDPKEEPYLRLLSMDSRQGDESIWQIRGSAVEWSKIPLDTGSDTEMRDALAALTATTRMNGREARMLGLAPLQDDGAAGDEAQVEIPAWRYAMINFPHPLLASGLAILDLPGMEDVAQDPELNVSMLPKVDAIVYVLAADAGISRRDIETWKRYVRPGPSQKIAVLNKADLLRAGGQAAGETAEARVEAVAQALALDPSRILALSAREALLGRIQGDAERVRQSGIAGLEECLAREVVPARRRMLCRMIMDEIGALAISARASLTREEEANLAQAAELKSQMGRSREVVMKLWQKIAAEKAAYAAALAEYKVSHADFSARRAALMDLLDTAKLDAMLAASAKDIEGSWTTAGLQRGMRELARLMSADFEHVFAASEEIKKLMQGVYDTFIGKFGFQQMAIPALDLDTHRAKLRTLVADTDAFAKDPVNILGMEKGFLVKKFYRTLVNQARAIFSDARAQSERWARAVTLPLETQMKDHRQQLQSRLDNLSKINEKSSGITGKLAELAKAAEGVRETRRMVEDLLARITAEAAEAAEAPPAEAAPEAPEAPAESGESANAPLLSDDFLAGLSTKRG